MAEKISSDKFPALRKTALTFPAIDNHAHPILRKDNRNAFPYEGVISEANGEALTRDASHTLACLRATPQLAKLLGLPRSASWQEVKAARQAYDYEVLCKDSFKDTAIETILIDDGLGDPNIVHEIAWHDQFTKSRCRRIVRVEVVAEVRRRSTVVYFYCAKPPRDSIFYVNSLSRISWRTHWTLPRFWIISPPRSAKLWLSMPKALMLHASSPSSVIVPVSMSACTLHKQVSSSRSWMYSRCCRQRTRFGWLTRTWMISSLESHLKLLGSIRSQVSIQVLPLHKI